MGGYHQLPIVPFEPQQNNPLQMLAGINQLKTAQLQQQGLQLENQTRQQDLATRQALNSAFANSVTKDEKGNSTFDPDKLQSALASGPAAYKTPEVLEGITKFQQGQIDLKKSVTDLQQKSADMIGGAASAVKAAGYDPALAHSLLDQLPGSPQINQIRSQIDGNPQQFKQLIDSAIANSQKQQELGIQKTGAEARVTAAQTASQRLQAELPGGPLSSGSQAQQRLNVESSPQALTLASRKAAFEAQARQQAAQGDPAVAGQMLAKGDLTLQDLKSRGTTPQYITQAVTAAQKIDPKYNPADEVIAESVAKSQGANQFFGSANSLISKGGTLDQLTALGKTIPEHDFPVLNSIDDWQKLARGKGPLAGYAATALGVADDYGKVMGGGTASDHARDAALQLFSKASSSEMRAQAIQSTRDAVQSQRDSRIGNNQFLKRQYGAEVGGKAGSGIAVTDPRGHIHSFPDQASADKFKKLANIQ